MSGIDSSRAPEPVGAYPHARRVGNLLFLSGIGPRERGRKEIPGVTLDGDGRVIEKDIEAQCHSCFSNVKHVLEDAGSSWDQIVDVLVFLAAGAVEVDGVRDCLADTLLDLTTSLPSNSSVAGCF